MVLPDRSRILRYEAFQLGADCDHGKTGAGDACYIVHIVSVAQDKEEDLLP
jgi:hypothetical protein